MEKTNIFFEKVVFSKKVLPLCQSVHVHINNLKRNTYFNRKYNLMKKLFYIAVIALAIIACEKKPVGPDQPDIPDTPDTPEVPVDDTPATFTATFAALTKATFNGTAFQWAASDEIAVFSGTDTKNYKYATTGSGASVTFTGEAPKASSYIAVYPYAAGLSLDGGSFTCDIPTNQVAAAGSCAPEAIVAVASSKTTDLEFKNVGTVVSFKVVADNIQSATITAVGMNDRLSGEAKVTVTDASVKVASTSASEDHVTIGGGLASGEQYNVVIIPGTYIEGLTISFKNDAGKVVTREIARFNAVAGGAVDFGTFTIEEEEWYMSYVLEGDDAVYAFAQAEIEEKEIVRDLTVKNCQIYPIRELKNRVKKVLGTFTMENLQAGGEMYMAMFQFDEGFHSITIKNCEVAMNPAFFTEIPSKKIDGNLIIDNCPKMMLNRTDGSSPGALTEVGGDLIINACDHVNGSTFQNLAKVGGDFILTNNTKTWDLREKQTVALTEIGGNLTVKGNPEFDSTIGFDKLTKIGGNVTFFGPYIPNENNATDLNIKGFCIFKDYYLNGVISQNATVTLGRAEENPIDFDTLQPSN